MYWDRNIVIFSYHINDITNSHSWLQDIDSFTPEEKDT